MPYFRVPGKEANAGSPIKAASRITIPKMKMTSMFLAISERYQFCNHVQFLISLFCHQQG